MPDRMIHERYLEDILKRKGKESKDFFFGFFLQTDTGFYAAISSYRRFARISSSLGISVVAVRAIKVILFRRKYSMNVGYLEKLEHKKGSELIGVFAPLATKVFLVDCSLDSER